VSGRADKGKAGPGTEEQQRQRQDAQQNPRKNTEQYIAEMQALDMAQQGDFARMLKLLNLARRDITTPQSIAQIEEIVAGNFVAKINACASLEKLEQAVATAARQALSGKAGEDVATAINAARVRLGSGQ
jgi:hypothetical protein